MSHTHEEFVNKILNQTLKKRLDWKHLSSLLLEENVNRRTWNMNFWQNEFRKIVFSSSYQTDHFQFTILLITFLSISGMDGSQSEELELYLFSFENPDDLVKVHASITSLYELRSIIFNSVEDNPDLDSLLKQYISIDSL